MKRKQKKQTKKVLPQNVGIPDCNFRKMTFTINLSPEMFGIFVLSTLESDANRDLKQGLRQCQ